MAWFGGSKRGRRQRPLKDGLSSTSPDDQDRQTGQSPPLASISSTDGVTQSGSSGQAENTDKSVRRTLGLLNFLKEMAEQGNRPIRNFSSYEYILWLDDIGGTLGCVCRAPGEPWEHGADLWLEAIKQPKPEAPRPPDPCLPWIEGDWDDAEREPELQSHVMLLAEPEPASAGELAGDDEEPALEGTETLVEHALEDHPEVRNAWRTYISDHWQPWVAACSEWQRGREVYQKLFAVHQAQERLGEAYELVMGFGLLTWQLDSSEPIRRHLICADVELTLNADRGQFEVRPSSDGAKLRVELDMVPVERRPADLDEQMKNAVARANDDPWDFEPIGQALRSAAQVLHEDGAYEDALTPPKGTSSVPRVDLAPALILRKRSMRGLIQTIETIREQVETECEVTPLLKIAVETAPNERPEPDEDGQHRPTTPEPIYMPLPTNDQQERIAERAATSHGVLVQGPPGTGKSHTIANLICHLLATGRRVLVTAQTPRALKVLVGDDRNNGKLPEELQPLCVGLMGRGRDEMRSLSACVDRVLGKRDSWDEASSTKTVERTERRLDELRKREAELNNSLRQIRERETYQHTFGDGAYRGTMADIARQVEADRRRFDWFEDEPTTESPRDPDLRERIGELLALHRRLTSDDERELAQAHPSKGDLPTPHRFREMARREHDAQAEADRWSEPGRWGDAMLRNPHEAIENAATTADALNTKVNEVRERRVQWGNQALREVLGEHETPWRELLDRSGALIEGLRNRARAADQASVQGAPEHLDTEALKFEASQLVEHLARGGSLRWSPFKRRPRPVRKAVKLVTRVRIGGRPCEDADTLGALVERLETETAVQKIERLWSGKAEVQHPLLADRVAEIDEHHEVLVVLLEVFDLLGAAKRAAHEVNASPAPVWSEFDQLAEFASATRYARARSATALIEDEWRIAREAVCPSASGQSHACNAEIDRAIHQRDEDAYTRCYAFLEDLWRRSADMKRRQELEQEIGGLLPKLTASIRRAPQDSQWPERLEDLRAAWAWASAQAALQTLLDEENAEEVERQLKDTTKSLQKAKESLAAEKAWHSCFTTMDDSHASHLKAWRQAVKSLGKGTGKHAEKHRNDARRHLEACREAIPAWVMPLHRLYEQINAKPEMFDIVIVDEASQCSHDALVLMYLAKHIIVVGDDQQISPSAGYVNGDTVDRLMHRYLPDLEHNDAFRKGKSLYDLAERWYGNSIVLREHFRCVPEIIRFSNDLCYHASPLIPLRQDPPRLEPLVRRHIESGYREGKGQRVINEPEAIALADAVAECCNDPRYHEKTMGVISMQSSGQAALIENLLLERLGAEEIERRHILCGDAYAFQGDERHIIFLSMVAAPNERVGALTKEDDKRRFNVAASRAQDQMWLFHTATVNHLNPNCMRRKLLEFFQDPRSTFEQATGVRVEELERVEAQDRRRPGTQPEPFDSWFEIDVALRVARAGYRIIPQYELAGYQIDLVLEGEVEGKLRRLAIECDGDEWHGPENFDEDMHRQRQLERAGMSFCRIRESTFYANPDKAMEPIWFMAKEMGMMQQPIK